MKASASEGNIAILIKIIRLLFIFFVKIFTDTHTHTLTYAAFYVYREFLINLN